MREAVARNAVVVVTRGWREWAVAVPELRAYEGAVRTNSPRGAYITQRNLPAEGFGRVMDALLR